MTGTGAAKTDQTPQVPRDDRRVRWLGAAILLAGFGGFLLWAATAKLDGAVVAPGEIKVDTALQAVEHRDGGIVDRIAFQAGDQVSEGDVLVELDDTELRAELASVRVRYASARAELERLEAEQRGTTYDADTATDESLKAPVAEPLKRQLAQARENQEAIFKTRQAAFEDEIEQLEQRRAALDVKQQGLRNLIAVRQESLRSYQTELDETADLVSEGYADQKRLRELERSVLDVEGNIADLRTQIQQTDVEITEATLAVAQRRSERNQEVAARLSEVRDRYADLQERRRALSQRVARTTLRAPADGTIVEKQVHTEGAVLEPGERVTNIVPSADPLVVEARVSPRDIDRVAVGQTADVRLTAYSFRRTPVVQGTVSHVSADRLEDEQSGDAYYLARLRLDRASLEAALGPDEQLLPGMPAEALLLTGERTVLSYLVKPIMDAVSRSFRES